MELNPNHPTTKAVHDHWHKIAAILMWKLKQDHVVFTSMDIQAFPKDLAIAIKENHDGLHIMLTDMSHAVRLAKKEGNGT